jgi:hypothetical protein
MAAAHTENRGGPHVGPHSCTRFGIPGGRSFVPLDLSSHSINYICRHSGWRWYHGPCVFIRNITPDDSVTSHRILTPSAALRAHQTAGCNPSKAARAPTGLGRLLVRDRIQGSRGAVGCKNAQAKFLCVILITVHEGRSKLPLVGGLPYQCLFQVRGSTQAVPTVESLPAHLLN